MRNRTTWLLDTVFGNLGRAVKVMIYDLKAPYFTWLTATKIDHFEVMIETGSVLLCIALWDRFVQNLISKVQRMAKWWEQSPATNVARV